MKIRQSLVTFVSGVAVAIAISGAAVASHSATAAGNGTAKITHSTHLASTDGQDPWPKL
jgi:ABC-type oligopeptide transport system substrate-binding subunit